MSNAAAPQGNGGNGGPTSGSSPSSSTNGHESSVALADQLTQAPSVGPAPSPAHTANGNGNGVFTAADAAHHYGVRYWGQGYFSVNDEGHVVVHPTKDPQRGIDLKKLVDELCQRDLQPPLLIRFTDILRHRVQDIHRAFSNAVRDHEYRGEYRCVYPIKVNQQRHVVEEILDFGRPFGFGLEAGSKPELLAIMAIVHDDNTPIICNGFKDDQFIEAVILATKMGKKVIPVVEKYSELALIVKYAQLHNVRPAIGIRVKLSAKGAGRWQDSGGVRSKFGLFISEVLDAVAFLKKQNMLDCLQLLHFHLGSQINHIRNVKAAINELCRVYVELHKMGAGLKYVDVGGGLGVDYDGSKTQFTSSINYSLQEYANDVVFHVKEVCDAAGVEHPTIISESGRAMVAYHSVLVFNVLGWSGFDRFQLPDSLSKSDRRKLPKPVQNLFDTFQGLTRSNFNEYYHDAQLARDEVQNLFTLGYCSLEDRGLGERLYFGICSKVLQIVKSLDDKPEEFAGLEAMLADTYFCNMSIFQSIPDSWAIDQLFPILPIHRLLERPTCQGILADITCDSDGKVDHFIGRREVRSVLDLHPLTGEEYYLAAFLVGAYQEILGDLHNLFGDTNAVHVSIDEAGRASIEEVVEGDTVTEVLQYVQFSAEELMRSMRKSVEKALREDKINLDESRLLLRFYETGLKGYTYLT